MRAIQAESVADTLLERGENDRNSPFPTGPSSTNDGIAPCLCLAAPDLVIELVSPNDRPSDIHAREADYRAIGVPELLFIDQQKRAVRLLRRRENYTPEERTSGIRSLTSPAGFWLDVNWLFAEPRHALLATLATLRGERAS